MTPAACTTTRQVLMTMTSALSMRGLFAARKIEPPIRTIHVRALKAVMYSWARKSRACPSAMGRPMFRNNAWR